ncbi:hypothetical protein IE077_002465, partial [Cardiosporidium cionae]
SYTINPTKEWRALGCTNIIGTAVVFYGVYGMINFQEGYQILRLGGFDAVLWLITFLVVLFIGTMEGIIISFILSVLWLLKESSRPSTAILGQLPNTCIYRNIKRFPMAKEIPGIRIFRFDASINFSNAEYFEKKIYQINMEENKILIIDGSSINRLDMTAVRILQKLAERFTENSKVLLLANWKGSMRDFLEKIKFYENVPLDRCFLSLHDAVCWSMAYLKSMSPSPESDISSFIYCTHPSQRHRNASHSSILPLARFSDDENSSSPFSRGNGGALTPTVLTLNHSSMPEKEDTLPFCSAMMVSFPLQNLPKDIRQVTKPRLPYFASLGRDKRGGGKAHPKPRFPPHITSFTCPPPLPKIRLGKRGNGRRRGKNGLDRESSCCSSPSKDGRLAFAKPSALNTRHIHRFATISLPLLNLRGIASCEEPTTTDCCVPSPSFQSPSLFFPYEQPSPAHFDSFWRHPIRHQTLPQHLSSPEASPSKLLDFEPVSSLRRRFGKKQKDPQDSSPEGKGRTSEGTAARSVAFHTTSSVTSKLSAFSGAPSSPKKRCGLISLPNSPLISQIKDRSLYSGDVLLPLSEEKRMPLLEPCMSIHEELGGGSFPYEPRLEGITLTIT